MFAFTKPANWFIAAVTATLRHADLELEALLPASLGGVALTVESQAGPDLSTNSAPFDAFLAGLGRTRADFTLASAYAQGGGLKAEVGAWRVKGADTALLLSSFEDVIQASSTTPLTVTASWRRIVSEPPPGRTNTVPSDMPSVVAESDHVSRGGTRASTKKPSPSAFARREARQRRAQPALGAPKLAEGERRRLDPRPGS